MNKLRGFTLIELMVAIGLTGLVAVGAYQTFDQAVRASSGAQERADQVNRLDRSWRLIEQDLQHAIPRQNVSVSAFQAPADAFYGQRVNTGHFDEGESGLVSEPLTLENPLGQPWFLRLNRLAWKNPLNAQRSDLQGVAYHMSEGKLWRLYWPVVNNDDIELDFSSLDFNQAGDTFAEDVQLEGSAMRQQILMEGVEGMAIRYLPNSASSLDNNSWQVQWPPASNTSSGEAAPASMPLAVEISIYLEGFGESKRLFLLQPEA